jgi:SAM-dependent methyltransferase
MRESEFYDRAYYDGDGKSNYVAYTKETSPFELHCSIISSVIEHMMDSGLPTVLDVGCAKGYLVNALRNRGILAYGLDWSIYAVRESLLDIRQALVVGSTLHLPFKSNSFSLSVSFDVLEHLDEPSARAAVRELSRVSDMQIHQVNTGRLLEWRFEGDDSHCLKLSLAGWHQLALEEGVNTAIMCEPDGQLAQPLALSCGTRINNFNEL